MNVLVISQFYRPDITAAAFRTSALVDGLRAKGHLVEVLTAKPHKVKSSMALAEAGVHRLPTLPAGRRSIGYIAHYLGFALLAAVRSLGFLQQKPDVVFVTSPPLFLAPSAVIAALRYRAPLVLEVRDIWPESAVAVGQIGADGWAFRVGKLLEAWTYRRADAIVAVAEPMAAEIASRASVQVEVAYNGVKVEPVHTDNVDPKRGSGVGGESVLAYVGNIGRAQSIDRLVEAFASAKGQGALSGWRFVLVGEGTERGRLSEEWAHDESVSFVGPLEQAAAQDTMAAASVLLLALTPDPTFDLTIPSKVFDYLNVGRPIVAALRGEGAEILRSTGANIVVDPGDETAISEALLSLEEMLPKLESLAGQNVELVQSRFTRERAVSRIEVLLETVTTGA